ncbi:MAG: hypothetical protein JXR68_13335 [Bacteroidales bacterium]|nr:hypothetical protein [Bacteroidales bacterium]
MYYKDEIVSKKVASTQNNEYYFFQNNDYIGIIYEIFKNINIKNLELKLVNIPN